MTNKVCNVCGVEKPIEVFRVKSRRCKECQNMINKEYSKHYYVQHRERLKEFGIKNYHAKAGEKKKVGRPRNPEYYKEEQEQAL